ncbi:MAG: hypothetical protein COZ18_02895 [Flexibacter sp. CG_4_10_14_3_um_filter_32_15]|nr:MAG: hypothetical protein COZ18_02895 [Flexibacter sp. CG_4_10_14_3_um_filter_32_15]
MDKNKEQLNHSSDNLPFVSVVMPVYNAEKYVAEAIESILNQTYTNFEFLIFNDGSKDKSAEIVAKYAKEDSRIIFFNYQENTGHLKHLNAGIEKAKGKYIARMDADDSSLPTRFEEQVQFMEENEEIVLLGTAYISMGERDDFEWKPKTQDKDIRLQLLVESPLAHPTVFMRAEILQKNSIKYHQEYYPAEDYAMWVKLSDYGKMANLSEILLQYRVHGEQISQQKSAIQIVNADKSRIVQLNKLGLTTDDIDINIYKNVFSSYNERNFFYSTEIAQVAFFIEKFIAANKEKEIYNQEKLLQFLQKGWEKMIRSQHKDYPLWLLKYVFRSDFPNYSSFTISQKIKFISKCIFTRK